MFRLNFKKKKTKVCIMGGIILVILIVSFMLTRSYWPKEEEKPPPQSLTSVQSTWSSSTQKLMGELKEGRDLEGLKIGLKEYQADSYNTFKQVGETFERADVNYYKVYVKVYNPSGEEKKTFSKIFLKDDLGNEYQPSIEILFGMRRQNIREFGMDMTIYPRTIREGYIFFPEIAKEAKKLNLVFELESGNQAIFEWNL